MTTRFDRIADRVTRRTVASMNLRRIIKQFSSLKEGDMTDWLMSERANVRELNKLQEAVRRAERRGEIDDFTAMFLSEELGGYEDMYTNQEGESIL